MARVEQGTYLSLHSLGREMHVTVLSHTASYTPGYPASLEPRLFAPDLLWRKSGFSSKATVRILSKKNLDLRPISSSIPRVFCGPPKSLFSFSVFLLQSEDKTFRPVKDVTGPLLVLTHVVRQHYFPRGSVDILIFFLTR